MAFREMRRFKQQIPQEECEAILKEAKRGVFCVLGDDDYPYGIPVDHWYDQESGHIYFHCAKVGHKLDAIARHDKVSFCVLDEGEKIENDWALIFRSVIVFGRAKTVDDYDERIRIGSEITRKFTDDPVFLEKEIANSGPRVQCVEIIPEHITGKRVVEN